MVMKVDDKSDLSLMTTQNWKINMQVIQGAVKPRVKPRCRSVKLIRKITFSFNESRRDFLQNSNKEAGIVHNII